MRVEVNHGQRAEEKIYILEKKPARASIFSRIFWNMKVRRTVYILKDIREKRGKPNLNPGKRPPAAGAARRPGERARDAILDVRMPFSILSRI